MITRGPHPTYQDALRAIGRYFDRHVYRHVLVSEVDDGYIARAFHGRRGTLGADGFALPLGDVLALISGLEQGRGVQIGDMEMPSLCPTGYEDCFRALGYDLDAAGATQVCLVELSGGILVSHTARGKRGLERPQRLYDSSRIEELLAKGYQRRDEAARTA